jgi:phosphatidylserine/phosphatidylglycerophosphate/cardiolipin synthase-like enzyme
MRTRYQLLLILLTTLGFWGYQLAHAAPNRFEKHTRYTVCFSPQGRCEQKLLHLIRNAEHSIFIQSYSFTSKKTVRALIQAHRRGVNIKLIVDRSLFDPKNHHSRISALLRAGVPAWVDNTVSIQHNKVMIVDKRWVETGSYNFTVSANRYNAENMLIIRSPALAARYLTNWHHQQLVSTPASDYHYKRHRRR